MDRVTQRNQFSLTTLRHAEFAKAGSALFPLTSVFNHSCWPNAAWTTLGAVMAVRATRPIRAGEEVTISYVFLSDVDVAGRRDSLRSSHGFDCACERCAAPAGSELHALDLDFRGLLCPKDPSHVLHPVKMERAVDGSGYACSAAGCGGALAGREAARRFGRVEALVGELRGLFRARQAGPAVAGVLAAEREARATLGPRHLLWSLFFAASTAIADFSMDVPLMLRLCVDADAYLASTQPPGYDVSGTRLPLLLRHAIALGLRHDVSAKRVDPRAAASLRTAFQLHEASVGGGVETFLRMRVPEPLNGIVRSLLTRKSD